MSPPQLLINTTTHSVLIWCTWLCTALYILYCCWKKAVTPLFHLKLDGNTENVYSKIDVYCTQHITIHLLIGFNFSLPQTISRIGNWIESATQTDSIHTQTLLNAYQFSLAAHISLVSGLGRFYSFHTCCLCVCVWEREQENEFCVMSMPYSRYFFCSVMLYLCAFRSVHPQFSSICVNILLQTASTTFWNEIYLLDTLNDPTVAHSISFSSSCSFILDFWIYL